MQAEGRASESDGDSSVRALTKTPGEQISLGRRQDGSKGTGEQRKHGVCGLREPCGTSGRERKATKEIK